MSSALVPLVVSRTFCASKRCSSHSVALRVNSPSPLIFPEFMACSIYLSSSPVRGGILKFIIAVSSVEFILSRMGIVIYNNIE